MTWKQRTLPIDENCQRVRDAVDLLALSAGNPPELALFCRTTADRCTRVLLLSPLAVELAGEALPPQWTDIEAPELFEWDMIFGQPGAQEKLGLPRPCFGKSKTPSPIFEIGRSPPA